MTLRHMRNKAAGTTRPRFREQARPYGACVASAHNGGRATFVIKLCPMMCAALVRSGWCPEKAFRVDTPACAAVTTRE
jgi:hypothetical protein